MTRRLSLSVLLLMVSLASGFLAGRASGGSPILMTRDALAAAPSQFKLLMENDQVRTLEFTGKAGQKTPMHWHPGHVVYPFSDGKTRFTMPDGSTRDLEIKKGVAFWVAPVTHAHEALTDNHVLLVELKNAKTTP